MTRKLIAPILAVSIALTSIGAAPLQAKSRDDQLGQFIAGAIALMIIGKAIEGNKRSQRTRPVATPAPPRVTRPAPPPRRVKVLPADCFFKVQDRFGDRGVYGERCLKDTLRHRQARKLPEQCEDNVRIRHGRRSNVYDARCLFQHGYKRENRGR